MGTAPPSVPGNDMLWPVIRFSHQHVYLDNCSCRIEQHSWTIAVIWLSCACKHTDCCGPSTPRHHNNTTWRQWPPSRTTCTDTPQTLLRNSSRDTINGPRCWPGLQIPQIPIWSSICRTFWSRSDPSRPHPPTHNKMPWCQTPEDTLRGFYIYIYIVCALCLRSTRAHHTSLRLGPTWHGAQNVLQAAVTHKWMQVNKSVCTHRSLLLVVAAIWLVKVGLHLKRRSGFALPSDANGFAPSCVQNGSKWEANVSFETAAPKPLYLCAIPLNDISLMKKDVQWGRR